MGVGDVDASGERSYVDVGDGTPGVKVEAGTGSDDGGWSVNGEGDSVSRNSRRLGSRSLRRSFLGVDVDVEGEVELDLLEPQSQPMVPCPVVDGSLKDKKVWSLDEVKY